MILYANKWTYAKTNWSIGDYFQTIDYIRIISNLRDCYTMAKTLYGLSGDVPAYGEFGLTVQSDAFFEYSGYAYAIEHFNKIEGCTKAICNAAGIGFTQKSWSADNYFLLPWDFNRIEGALQAAFNTMAMALYGQYRLPFRLGTGRELAFAPEYDSKYRCCMARVISPDLNAYFGPETKSLVFEWEIYATNYVLEQSEIYLTINGGMTGTSITVSNGDIVCSPINGGYHCSYNWTVPDGYYEQIKNTPLTGLSFGFFPKAGFGQSFYMPIKKPVTNVDFDNVVYAPKGSATITTASSILVQLSIPAVLANQCKYVHIDMDDVTYVPTESGLTGYSINMPLKVGENIMYIRSEDFSGQKFTGYLIIRRN